MRVGGVAVNVDLDYQTTPPVQEDHVDQRLERTLDLLDELQAIWTGFVAVHISVDEPPFGTGDVSDNARLYSLRFSKRVAL